MGGDQVGVVQWVGSLRLGVGDQGDARGDVSQSKWGELKE